MEVSTGFAEADGARLYYEVAGSGPAVILIPAQSLDTRMWDDQFLAFAESHRVVRYDVRACGQSSGSNEDDFSYYDDLKVLMDHLNIDKASLIGVSLGGGIALNFAILHPESVSGLILVDTYFNAIGHWPQMTPLIQELVSIAKKSGPEKAKEFWMQLPWFTAALEKPDVAARLAEMVADYPGHFAGKGGHDWSKPWASDHLDEIKTPTLVIVGERDTSDNRAVTDFLSEQISGARKSVMKGVGHIANMEDPRLFNEIVLEFLADM
ncbi:alpha/beta fold hydrolase [Candidatus Hydrogenedentota bacterium]